MKKTLLIDLDGVLNTYRGYYKKNIIPPPAEGVENFLKELSSEYNIEIFTTRSKEPVLNWLKKYSLNAYIADVTNIKKPCFLYVDDRAVCHNGNYDLTIKKIRNFKPHWFEEEV